MHVFNEKHDSWMRKNPGLYKRPSWKGRGNSSFPGDLEPVVKKPEVKLDIASPEESNGLSFGASMAKSLYVGLSSFNNFLRSMAEQQNKEAEGLTGSSSGKGLDDETKRNLVKQKMQLDALLKDPSALDASVYEA